MRKHILCFCFFVLFSILYAGDVATFVNLGFSDDGSFFAFGQHGLTDEKYQGYAEIYCVDVQANDFVPAGRFKTSPTVETADKDSKNIFLSLLDRASLTLSKWNINQKNEGRPIYVLTNESMNEKTLIFRDFETNDEYTVVLHKKHKTDMSSSFYISVEIIKPNGSKISGKTGQMDKIRPGVKDYVIKKILIDKSNTSLIFVIEKHIYNKEGNSIRYMVETMKLSAGMGGSQSDIQGP